jgi:tetratricopeptide (TPR) repeat protein
MLKKHFILLSSCLAIVAITNIPHSVQPAAAQSNQPALIASADKIEQLLESANQKSVNGDYKGAIADVTSAIKLSPKQVDLYSLRAAYRSSANDLPGALADHDQTIKLEPKSDYYFHSRSSTRRVAGDVKGAINDLSSALQFAANDGNAGIFYGERAFLYQETKAHQKAIADYGMAIKYQDATRFADLHRGRADSHIALGNKAAAIKDLEMAIALYQKQGSESDSLREAAMEELAKLK